MSPSLPLVTITIERELNSTPGIQLRVGMNKFLLILISSQYVSHQFLSVRKFFKLVVEVIMFQVFQHLFFCSSFIIFMLLHSFTYHFSRWFGFANLNERKRALICVKYCRIELSFFVFRYSHCFAKLPKFLFLKEIRNY